MNVEIICVGTELLLGDILNTNAQFISKELSKLGINVFFHTVVGDNEKRLKDCLIHAFERSNFVITTGGLGPTFDDMTKDIVASYFGKKLVFDKKAIQIIEKLFEKLNRKMTENNLKQALVIDGCTVLDNDNGYAPGMFYCDKEKSVVMLPGPPNEMKPMFLNKLLPLLDKSSDSVLLSKNAHIFGIGESSVESTLHDLMVNSKNPTIAPYAKEGEMYVRVTAKAKNEKECLSLIDPIVQTIKDIFGENVYGINVKSMQDELVNALKAKHLTLAVAESCTSGLLASMIAEVPGCSDVFLGGIVSYSNDIKTNILNVRKDTIEKYGAVSEQTANEMAKQIANQTNSDIGVSITGIAGPGGGSEQKPVGLVYVGLHFKHQTKTYDLQLSRGRDNERNKIRKFAALNAMFIVLSMINEL